VHVYSGCIECDLLKIAQRELHACASLKQRMLCCVWSDVRGSASERLQAKPVSHGLLTFVPQPCHLCSLVTCAALCSGSIVKARPCHLCNLVTCNVCATALSHLCYSLVTCNICATDSSHLCHSLVTCNMCAMTLSHVPCAALSRVTCVPRLCHICAAALSPVQPCHLSLLCHSLVTCHL